MKTMWSEQDRGDIRRRVELVKTDAAANWGRMSAPQMMAHLTDCLRMALGDLAVAPKKLPIRYPPLKQLIIYVVPFPKGAPTAPELINRLPASWGGEVADLTMLVDRFGREPRTRAWPDHPAFGTMTAKSWGVLVYRHMDHHLRQFGAQVFWPSIHDITTDPDDPPAFIALLGRRAGRWVSPPEYDGPKAAAGQRRAYPDIQPLILNAPLTQAFEAAAAAARAMGWETVEADRAAGRIEAIATTRLMRFKDDVVVRLRGDVGGVRVDVRSKSRVGRGDLGTNARRIRRFLAALIRSL